MILKLALRLAFSRDIRQRWRQVSVCVSAAVVTVTVLLGVGLIEVGRLSDAHIAARSPAWSASPSSAVLHLSARGLRLPGLGQIPVVWLDPERGHENDPLAVPAGLLRLPRPGEAVLSPGLIAAGWAAPDFGLLPSQAGAGPGGSIGESGLSTLSEGWIYARPAVGRSLGTGGALLASAGYGVGGQSIGLETVPEVPSLREAWLGAFWMLFLPAAFLAVGSARAMSDVRDARSRVLWQLGLPRWRIRTLLALEGLLLSMPGAAGGVLIWWAAAQTVHRLPLTVALLLPPRLAYPMRMAFAAAAVVCAIYALSSCFLRLRSRSVRADARTVRGWHVLPLVVALVSMVLSQWLSPHSSVRLYLLFGGLLLTFIALPTALPVIVRKLGASLAFSRRPTVWLAGRRLTLRSANLSKPAAMVGALVFVAGSAFAIYDRLVAPEAEYGARVPAAMFSIDWRDGQGGDLARLRANLATIAVLPMHQGDDGSITVTLASCRILDVPIVRETWPQNPCTPKGGIADAFTGRFSDDLGVRVVEGSPEPGVDADRALLIAPIGTTEVDLMRASTGLPAVNISAIGGSSKLRDARAGWMLLGWLIASCLLVAALVREIGDRALTSLGDTTHLTNLGLSRDEIESSYRWSLLTPVAVAVPIGFLGAVVFALIGYEIGVTIDSLARIGVVSGASTLLAVGTFLVVFRLHRRMSQSS